MEGLITFLAIVALVAIAFGTSMTSAFWGIIIFVIGATIIALAIGLFSSGALKLLEWFNSPDPQPAPKPKPVIREAVIVKKPKHPLARKVCGIAVSFVITYVISDLFLISIGILDNHKIPIWALFVMPALPFVVFWVSIAIRNLITKKHAKRKAKRA